MEQRNEMNDKKKLKLIHEYGSTRLFSTGSLNRRINFKYQHMENYTPTPKRRVY